MIHTWEEHRRKNRPGSEAYPTTLITSYIGGRMLHLRKTLTVAGAALAITAPLMATGSPAFAAARDGVCEAGEFCYYFNSNEAGSVSDFVTSVGNYGTTQPTCYDFKGPGAGQ